jgi:hypothetical protein
VTCWASLQPTPSARVPHQSTRFRPRVCLLGSHRYVSSRRGVIPQKPLILETSMMISSLNVYGRISVQEKRITTLDSSKCASWQDTQCAIIKTKGWGHCVGQITKVCFKGKFIAKFLTAENAE